jgi:predicted ATP-dependent endonuclease of OLD family
VEAGKMILKSAHIENFRSLKDVTVSFGRQTAILGGNGTGKSTILKAIERFYAPSTNTGVDDFFGKEIDNPVYSLGTNQVFPIK